MYDTFGREVLIHDTFCRETLKYNTFCRETLKYGTFCRETLKYALRANKMANLRGEPTPHFMLLCRIQYIILAKSFPRKVEVGFSFTTVNIFLSFLAKIAYHQFFV